MLFNTLANLRALIATDPERAGHMLDRLIDYLRASLGSLCHERSSVGQELDLAQSYLELLQTRMEERLRFRISADDAARQHPLPPLLLQPLVENAVRHGVEPSAQGADVRISTQRRGSTVVIKVTNTVPAGPGAMGHGVALANVRDRLNLLHDVEAQFRSGLHDGVYRVRMEVPA